VTAEVANVQKTMDMTAVCAFVHRSIFIADNIAIKRLLAVVMFLTGYLLKFDCYS